MWDPAYDNLIYSLAVGLILLMLGAFFMDWLSTRRRGDRRRADRRALPREDGEERRKGDRRHEEDS